MAVTWILKGWERTCDFAVSILLARRRFTGATKTLLNLSLLIVLVGKRAQHLAFGINSPLVLDGLDTERRRKYLVSWGGLALFYFDQGIVYCLRTLLHWLTGNRKLSACARANAIRNILSARSKAWPIQSLLWRRGPHAGAPLPFLNLDFQPLGSARTLAHFVRSRWFYLVFQVKINRTDRNEWLARQNFSLDLLGYISCPSVVSALIMQSYYCFLKIRHHPAIRQIGGICKWISVRILNFTPSFCYRHCQLA